MTYVDFFYEIPEKKGLITGSIQYEGKQFGTLIIDAYSYTLNGMNRAVSSASYEWNLDDSTKQYTLSELPYGRYLVKAFIDVYSDEFNGIPDYSEPQGEKDIQLSESTNTCDIKLTENIVICPKWDFYKDEEGIINYLDLGMLVDHWLTSEDSVDWDPVYNLSTDPDKISGKQVINFMDLGVFVNHWLEDSPCR